MALSRNQDLEYYVHYIYIQSKHLILKEKKKNKKLHFKTRCQRVERDKMNKFKRRRSVVMAHYPVLKKRKRIL